jgi:molybdopterin converting factor small subunit
MMASGTIIAAAAYGIGAGIISIPQDLLPEKENEAAARAESIPTVEAKLVETHTVEYIREKVIDTEYVDVIKNVPVELRNFNTLDELEQWLDGIYNQTTIRFIQNDSVIDCDDYALEMQQKALSDGYIMSFQIINYTEYNQIFAFALPEGQSLHAINLAIIGNSVFYIEPQTGEIAHAAYLD